MATLMAAAACSPPLDWREARLDGGALTALFPCRPVEMSRVAPLLDQTLRMTLHSCVAEGATFAVTHADVADPARVAPTLAHMRAALAANLGAAPADTAAVGVAAMTAGGQAVRLRLRGHLPDHTGVDAQAVFFASGTHVYQAVVLGKANADAADTFFGALRLPT